MAQEWAAGEIGKGAGMCVLCLECCKTHHTCSGSLPLTVSKALTLSWLPVYYYIAHAHLKLSIIIFFQNLFYVHKNFACMCVSVSHVCLVSEDARRERWVSQNCNYKWLSISSSNNLLNSSLKSRITSMHNTPGQWLCTQHYSHATHLSLCLQHSSH